MHHLDFFCGGKCLARSPAFIPLQIFPISVHFVLHFQNLSVLVIPDISKEFMFCVLQSLQEFEVVTISRDDDVFLMAQWTQHLEFGTLISGSLDHQSGPVTKQGLSNLKIILFKRRIISPSKYVSEEEGNANNLFRRS